MSDFMDALQFHKNEQTGKWRVQKLGYAKPSLSGDGWDIYFDALPMPTATGCRVSLQPQRDRPSPDRTSQDTRGGGGFGNGGEIPFAAEWRV